MKLIMNIPKEVKIECFKSKIVLKYSATIKRF